MISPVARHRRRSSAIEPTKHAAKRVAAYVRLSVATDQEFSSIDSQIASIRAFVESRKGDSWKLVEPLYVDDGRSGGDLQRPSVQKLIADIESSKIDIVIVTKIDRLSRSLFDFARMMDLFERHAVTFVSVTQDFNTTSASGRLMLSLLMGFAEYERSTIGERTKEKLAAARRGGRYCAGRSTTGFDVVNGQLIVNEEEAARVREIFKLYAERRSLLAVAEEVNSRGWTTKAFTRRDQSIEGGRPWNAESVSRLLRNAVVCGFVRCGDELVRGIHQPIVDEATWREVQATLKVNGSGMWKHERKPSRTLLTGLLYCGTCGARYVASFTGSVSGRRYGAYVCTTSRSRGVAACNGSRAPIAEIDAAVLNQIRIIGRDPLVFESTFRAARDAAVTRKPELESERDRIDGELRKLEQSRAKLVDAIANGNAAGRDAILKKLGELDVENDKLARELERVRDELRSFESATIDADDLKRVLEQFDDAWESLVLDERRRLLALLIERIEYDGQARSLGVRFRANGIAALSNQGEAIHD